MSPPRPVPEHENDTDAPGNSSSSTPNVRTAAPADGTPSENGQIEGSRSTNAQSTNEVQQERPNSRNEADTPQERRERPFRDEMEAAWAAGPDDSRTFTFPNEPGASFENMRESFTERLHSFLHAHRPEQPPRSESRGSEQDTLREPNTDTSNDHQPSGSPNSMSIFDEILDTVLGHRSNNQPSRTTPNQDSNSNSNSNTEGAQGSADSGATDATVNTSSVDGATVFTTGSPGDNPGAIVITVNYMFMDGANEPAPGRTGSLVVTIPNNATNREPHIISSFISLATRMAYSALINNGPKPKPGITLEKFRSFKSLNVDDLTDKTCSVCFEQYDRSPLPIVEDLITTKRRKLSPTSHVPSGSATPEQSASETAQIERDRPPSTDADSDETAHGENGPRSTEPESKIYLCDHDEEFDHTPVEMPCKHVFGRSCLAQWLKESTSCPLCRQSVADPDQPTPRSTNVPPISYIRFGGPDGSSGDLFNPSPDGSQQSGDNDEQNPNEENSNDANSQDTQQNAQGSESGQNEPSSLPALLRRATQVIFNQSARRNRETPTPPLEVGRGSGNSRDRNPPFSPVINNIQNYFRRARRQRDSDTSGSNSIFASGVASRRTPNGVETVTSDGDPLRGLFGSSSLFMNEFGSSARTSRGSNSAGASSERSSGRSTRDQQNEQQQTDHQADHQADHQQDSDGVDDNHA